MAVTSLAVSRLRVAFWGNPSHKAGARGAVLVSIRGRLEGWPAGQVRSLRHGLTLSSVLWHRRGPIGARGSHNFPKKPWQGREQGPCHFCTPVAQHARTRHAPLPAQRYCKGSCAPRQSLLGHQRSCCGHKRGEVFVSLPGLPCGTGQTAARRPASVPPRLPEASALCGGCMVTQRRGTGGGKPSWPSLSGGRSASFALSHKAVAAWVSCAWPAQVRFS